MTALTTPPNTHSQCREGLDKCYDHRAPGAQIWITGKDPFQEGGACEGRREGEEEVRGQESKFLPKKDEALAWFG